MTVRNGGYQISVDPTSSVDDWQPALALAVLKEAMMYYKKRCASTIEGMRDGAADVVQWVISDGDNYPFSFNNTCVQAGINPDFMRKHLKRIFRSDGFLTGDASKIRIPLAQQLVSKLRVYPTASPEALRAAIGVVLGIRASLAIDFSRIASHDARRLQARGMYVHLALQLGIATRSFMVAEFSKRGCTHTKQAYDSARNQVFSPQQTHQVLALLLKYAVLRARHA